MQQQFQAYSKARAESAAAVPAQPDLSVVGRGSELVAPPTRLLREAKDVLSSMNTWTDGARDYAKVIQAQKIAADAFQSFQAAGAGQEASVR